jgi:predicted membrane-bound mannosyltransferase
VWRQRKPCSIPPVKIWLAGGLGLLITAVLLFTWAGQNWPALGDLFRALPHLAARAGGEGHEKPVWYYLVLLAGGWSGAAILILAALGFSQAFRRPAAGPKLFIAVYAQLILAIYSAIPYKTPWLALNFWLPISLLAGFAIERIWLANPNPTVRAGILTGCAALGLLIIHDTRHWVFLQPADQKNPYAYAHTSGDLLRLPARLEDLARENHLAHPRIAVVAADPWPLPWYLRKFSSAGYWQPDQAPGDADFVITTTDVSGLLAARLKDFHPEFFGLRPNALLILWSPSKIDSRHE